MIYLDNAATSWPKPETVYQTMDDFLRRKGGNPGRGSHSLALAARETVEETRRLVAQLINAPDPERVIFTPNCTQGLNLGIKGLLSPGDHVITSELEHNSVARPLRKLEQLGVRVTRLAPSEDSGVVTPGEFERVITKDTRLLVVTHASNVTGVIQPVEAYGALARKHGLVFMVDAAQTTGKRPLDVQAGNIDLVAFSGHKGLFGPPGTGVLYVGSRVELDTLYEGGTGSYSEQEEQPATLPDRYESGTINSVGISGLGAGLKYILSQGLEKIQRHGQELVDRLTDGLAGIPRVRLYTPRGRFERVPIVSLNLEGYEPGWVGTILDQSFDIKVRAGLHCAPAAHKTLGTYPLGTVRLSPGYFSTLEEMDSVVRAIREIAKAGRLNIESGC